MVQFIVSLHVIKIKIYAEFERKRFCKFYRKEIWLANSSLILSTHSDTVNYIITRYILHSYAYLICLQACCNSMYI